MLDRRTFLQGAAAGAAAAGLGLLRTSVREFGPVELRALFLWGDPIVMKARLYSDEDAHVFGIRVLNDEGAECARTEMGLDYVRFLVEPGGPDRLGCLLTIRGEKGKAEIRRMVMEAGAGRLTLFVEDDDKPHGEPLPVWLSLEDVRRVV